MAGPLTPGPLVTPAVPPEVPTEVPPLVVHVVHRFDTGGLENGVVNLINHMPVGTYRHAVLSLTDITDFKLRVRRPDVQFLALNKPPGHALWIYPQIARLLRSLRPAIVHTRNLAALEVAVPAWFAGVPVRVHGEHGRDEGDLDGNNRRYQCLRKLYRPFVTNYVALSRDLAGYLEGKVSVPATRVAQIYNGVNLDGFRPTAKGRERIAGCPFGEPGQWLLGTVGRMKPVKDQLSLARAFIRALELAPELRARLRLVLVGEGPLRAQVQQLVNSAGIAELVWLPGEREDVADVMRGLNCFALPSLAEGISNTILEAMSTGLPVIATNVGGNAELVSHGRSGEIIPALDVQAMAAAILRMVHDPDGAAAMGRQGRADVQARFSLQAMVAAYQALYDRLLKQKGGHH